MAIGSANECDPLGVATNVAWPIAFVQQQKLTDRIDAQTECLIAFNIQ
jgi:hypothetical protein